MAQNFNAAVGGSESAINDVLAQIFATLRPTGIFHFKPDINLDGVSSADVDIVDAPRLSLKNSVPKQIEREISKYTKDLQDAGISVTSDDVAREIASHTITVNFPTVDVLVHYTETSTKPTEIKGELEMVLTTQIDMSRNPPAATFKGISARATTEDKRVEDLINKTVFPTLLVDINKFVFERIKIPTISLPGVSFSAPALVVSDGFLVAYSAVGIFPPVIPDEPINWPKDEVFACVDSDAISAMMMGPLRKVSIERLEFEVGVFSGVIELHAGDMNNVTVNSNGSVTSSMKLRGQYRGTVDTGIPLLPAYPIDISVFGSAEVTGSARITSSVLMTRVDDIGQIVFDIQLGDGLKPWGFLPDFVVSVIDGQIANLRVELVRLIEPFLESQIAGIDVPVMIIPPLFLPFAEGIPIHVHNLTLIGEDIVGETYLMAEAGIPKVG